MKFFSATSKLKELLLLQHIENNPDTTQKEIAEIINGAPSMVNVYIGELEEKNYLVREYQSSKIVYYRITPEGFKRMNYLLITYIRELLDLYKLAKENVEKFLVRVENRGRKNILLYGAGEVAETIIGVIRGRENPGLSILAIVDDDMKKVGKEILGYKIISRDDIDNYTHDSIIITSYTFEDEIIGRLKEIEYPEDRIIRFFRE